MKSTATRYLHVALIFSALLFSGTAFSKENYQISLLRAAPGEMPELIESVKQRKTQLNGNMLIMRHSQGDHWDLMLLMPLAEGQFPQQHSYQSYVDFQHDFTATSDAQWSAIQKSSIEADLFHIEMFQAAHGLYDELLQQRVMENNYLLATERNANLIFETSFGSDVDVFTLGIYSDLLSFATTPDLAPERFEKAATDAGFKARSDIGFYLREFLVGHQDTLATQIK
jgi:hypothetical protein